MLPSVLPPQFVLAQEFHQELKLDAEDWISDQPLEWGENPPTKNAYDL